MPSVFISHSSLDHERVKREIISPLRAQGVETWYSTDNIKSASEWERQIRVGLKQCDWFMIVLSPHSVASEWVGREVHWAFEKRKTKIIPVMLETCERDELHLGLLPLQYIDFRDEVTKAQERLLAIWGLDKATQIETRYQAAQEALVGNEWNTAVEHLEAVLRLDPAHQKAEAELNRARRYQELAPLYDAGLTHLQAKRWREALATLQQVHEIEANYKDVADSIALANAELQKEEAERTYGEALDAAKREEWVAAVEQLEAVLKLNPSHGEAQAALSRAEQQRQLAELHAAGREHLQAGRWREALKSFRSVRSIDKSYRGVADLIAEADAGLEEEEVRRPERERQEREAKEEAERQAREQQAQQAREQLYRETLDSIGREDWDAAREKLQAVMAADPGNDELAAELAEVNRQHQLAALFDGGLQHSKNGRWAEALGVFRQVQEADEDHKDVSAQIERAETELKSLQEQEQREQQAKEEAEQKRRAEAKRKNFEFEAWRDVELTPGADNTGRKLVKVLAIPIGVLLVGILAFALWPKPDPPPRGNSNATTDTQAASGADPFNRAEAFRKQDKYAEAEAEYRKAIALAPNNGDYHDGLGKALYNQSKLKEAEAESRKAVDLNANKAEYHNGLGDALHDQGEYKEAEAEYRKAIHLDPDNALFYKNLANTLEVQNRMKEARAEARKAETRYKKAIESTPNEAEYYNGLGSALRHQVKYKEAEAALRKATGLSPNNAGYHNSLAVALDRLGKYQEAEAEYRRALELEPNDANFHNNLGVLLTSLNNRVQEGVAELRKAIELSPGTALYHRNLAYTLEQLKRNQEAKAEHQKAKELESRSP